MHHKVCCMHAIARGACLSQERAAANNHLRKSGAWFDRQTDRYVLAFVSSPQGGSADGSERAITATRT